MLAAERDEGFGLGEDDAPVRGSGHGDATAAAELEQSLVAQYAQRAEHGVGVDADDGGQIFGGRETLARTGFTVGDRASDLRGDLLMQVDWVGLVDLDGEHNASYLSFIVAIDQDVSATAPPRTPQPDEIDALIEEAWRHARHRQRRRRAAVAAGVGLAVLVALVWAAVSDGGRARHDPAAGVRGVAGAHATTSYRYTRAIISASPNSGLAARSTTVENWVGTDGSWRLRETTPGHAPGSLDVVIAGDGLLPPQTNATGAFDGVPFNPRDPGDGLFTTGQVAALPSDAGALGARLRQAVTAEDLRDLAAYLGHGQHTPAQRARLRRVFLSRRVAQTLLAIADLDMAPVPRPLVLALYHVARDLPGAQVTRARRAAGRDEVAITAQGYSMTFDDRTGALRAGSTGVFFDLGSTGTVVAEGTVSSLDAIPRGIAPVQSPVAHPPAILLVPRTGTATTTFTFRIRLNNTPVTAHTAAAPAAEMFGPTGPNCAYWASRPPVARVGPGPVTRSASGARATYRVAPRAIGRRTWCPGRYQLMINPIRTTHQQSTVPRSFAATYFEIH